MNALAHTTDKVIISPLGLEIREELTFEEWSSLAPQLGTAVRSMQFVIGDWLVLGETYVTPDGPKRGRVTSERYEAACAATGLDKVTLKNYAYVSRRCPRSLRNDLLSWEHHKAVAKLKPAEQSRWLALAANPDDHLSSRRLRVSITRGKVVPIEDMAAPPADQGIINHLPYINRLCSWMSTAGDDWFKSRTPEQIDAMLRDFAPVVRIIQRLREIRLVMDNPNRGQGSSRLLEQK